MREIDILECDKEIEIWYKECFFFSLQWRKGQLTNNFSLFFTLDFFFINAGIGLTSLVRNTIFLITM